MPANTFVATAEAVVAGRRDPAVRRRRPRHAALTAGRDRGRGDRRDPGGHRGAPVRADARHGRDRRSPTALGIARHRGRRAGPGRHAGVAGGPARSGWRAASASTRARTSALSATPAPWSPPTRARRPAACPCATTAGRRARTTTTASSARTAGSTPSRPSCSARSSPHLDEWNEARRDLMALYRELLDPARCTPVAEHAGRPTACTTWRWCGSPNRERVRASWPPRHRDRHPLPDPVPPACAVPRVTPTGRSRSSSAAAEELLSLPMYPHLEPDDVRHVAEIVNASPTGGSVTHRPCGRTFRSWRRYGLEADPGVLVGYASRGTCRGAIRPRRGSAAAQRHRALPG